MLLPAPRPCLPHFSSLGQGFPSRPPLTKSATHTVQIPWRRESSGVSGAPARQIMSYRRHCELKTGRGACRQTNGANTTGSHCERNRWPILSRYALPRSFTRRQALSISHALHSITLLLSLINLFLVCTDGNCVPETSSSEQLEAASDRLRALRRTEMEMRGHCSPPFQACMALRTCDAAAGPNTHPMTRFSISLSSLNCAESGSPIRLAGKQDIYFPQPKAAIAQLDRALGQKSL